MCGESSCAHYRRPKGTDQPIGAGQRKLIRNLPQIWPEAEKLFEKCRHVAPDEKAHCVVPRQVLYRQVCYMQLGQFPPNHDLIERAMIEHPRCSSVSHGTILDRLGGVELLVNVRKGNAWVATAFTQCFRHLGVHLN